MSILEAKQLTEDFKEHSRMLYDEINNRNTPKRAILESLIDTLGKEMVLIKQILVGDTENIE